LSKLWNIQIGVVGTFFEKKIYFDTWFLEFEIELGYQGEKLIHYVVINHL
jgi:hypothetical protein